MFFGGGNSYYQYIFLLTLLCILWASRVVWNFSLYSESPYPLLLQTYFSASFSFCFFFFTTCMYIQLLKLFHFLQSSVLFLPFFFSWNFCLGSFCWPFFMAIILFWGLCPVCWWGNKKHSSHLLYCFLFPALSLDSVLEFSSVYVTHLFCMLSNSSVIGIHISITVTLNCPPDN